MPGLTTAFTISLDDPDARDPSRVGEKAAALARMRQHGLPVPGGFVVPASAYVAAISAVAGRIAHALEGIASDGAVAHGSALDDASATARSLVEEAPLPEGLSEAVRAAYESLGHDTAVAVRSSGTAEDLAGASFAGQYDSFLNVRGADALLGRLVAVWSSLHSPHAIAYRSQQGVSHEGAHMAVLVQELLPADAAGVLFTRDPMSGDTSRMVVNATLGLGEGVVAGETQSDVFSIDSSTLAVVERTIARKAHMIAPSADGGVELRPVPDHQQTAPSLTDVHLAELGRLSRIVRELEGGDRDIEFAVSDGAVHLLQARPVTGIEDGAAPEPFDVTWSDPEDARHAWVLQGGFVATEPIARFEEDVRQLYARHQQSLFEETGAPMAKNHIIRFFHGYMYVRAPEVDQEEVGRRFARLQQEARGLAATGGNFYFDVIEPDALRTLERLGPFRRPARESVASRLAFLEEVLEAYGHVMGDLHWRQIIGVPAIGAEQFAALYSELTGEPEVNAGVLLQGIKNTTTKLVRRLRRLARAVQDDPSLREIFAARAFERLGRPDVRTRPAVRRFRARFNRLLRDHGRRSGRSYGSSTTFETPTWNLDHSVPLETIAAYAEQDVDELDRLERRAREERDARRARLRGELSAEDWRRFDEHLGAAEFHVLRMENHNAIMEQGVAGVLREAIWWMGQGLVRAGRLHAPDDALHLSMDELRAAAAGDALDLRAIVTARVAERQRRAAMTPPTFVGDGDRSELTMPPMIRDLAESSGGLSGSVLSGTAASRGRYTGRARVAIPGAPPPKIERGDILVARNAGQEWTPVLSLLGGIVLDGGAIFQHAALIAREYRIPAVFQTREATSVITDGQRITVDGDAGTVDLSGV